VEEVVAKAVSRQGVGEVMGLNAALFVVGGELLEVLSRVASRRGVGREEVLLEVLLKMEESDGNGCR
jgi:hypothetical protein